MAGEAPKQVASAIVKRNGLFLMIQEAEPKEVRGLWNFPGGHVEPGETREQAAARETYEEAGYRVAIGELIFRRSVPEVNIELNAYDAVIIGGDEGPLDEEILQVGWFPESQLLVMKAELRDPAYVHGALKAHAML